MQVPELLWTSGHLICRWCREREWRVKKCPEGRNGTEPMWESPGRGLRKFPGMHTKAAGLLRPRAKGRDSTSSLREKLESFWWIWSFSQRAMTYFHDIPFRDRSSDELPHFLAGQNVDALAIGSFFWLDIISINVAVVVLIKPNLFRAHPVCK